jgi:hypothetical protein
MLVNMPIFIDFVRQKTFSADTPLRIRMDILDMLRTILEAPATQTTKETILVFFIVMIERI